MILLCSDVSDTGPCPVPTAEIAAAVRERTPGGVRVLTVTRLCSWPAGLPAALRSLPAHRAVAGCRHGTARHGEIAALLRRAGIPRQGIRVVDLMPAGHPDPTGVARQSAARLRAAAAQVAQADLDAPFRAGADGAARSFSRQAFSRRALFHPASMADAMSLAGWSLPGLEAAAGELTAEALRPGPGRVHGVAITCVRAARRLPVGTDWLPLEVPSLEMVSAGWPLRILATGAGVAFAACDDAGCASRARELDEFCAGLAEASVGGWHRLDTPLGGWAPAEPSQRGSAGATPAAPPPLREPGVTAGARCESCGQPLSGGLSGEAVALRLAASHPQVAARLRHESRCTDCLLKSGKTAAFGSRPPGPAP